MIHMWILILLLTVVSPTFSKSSTTFSSPSMSIIEVTVPCKPYAFYDNNTQRIFGPLVEIWNLVKTKANIRVEATISMTNWTEFIQFGIEMSKSPREVPHVFVSCVSVSFERMHSYRFDFTYPFLVENIGLMSIETVALSISRENMAGFWAAALYYFCLTIIFGGVFYVVEFAWLPETAAKTPLTKIVDCVYFSFVTASTVGFGDITPKTRAGRASVVLWITITLGIVSLLTALFLLAVTPIDNSHIINDRQQLRGKKLGVQADSVYETSCHAMGDVFCIPLDDQSEDIGSLATHKTDYNVMSMYRVAELVNEIKDVHLKAHPYLFMTSHLAFFTQPVFSSTVTSLLNDAIFNCSDELEVIRKNMLDSRVDMNTNGPTIFDLLASDGVFYTAVSMSCLVFVLFFCGMLWFPSTSVASEAHQKKKGKTAVEEQVRRLHRDVVALTSRHGSAAATLVCLSALSCEK
eukprot:PhF_6_TR23268/c0_g1_i7/m.32729